MPLIKIHTQKGKSKQARQAIMDGVHKALVSAFKIPEKDRTILLSGYPKEHFSGRDKNFTIVEVIAFAGRSKDAKRQLITSSIFRTLEVPKNVTTRPPPLNLSVIPCSYNVSSPI